MLTYAFFLSNRRESLVRAFRKKTPLSVRRPGGGGLRGVRKVSIETELFFDDGFPKCKNAIQIDKLKPKSTNYKIHESYSYWDSTADMSWFVFFLSATKTGKSLWQQELWACQTTTTQLSLQMFIVSWRTSSLILDYTPMLWTCIRMIWLSYSVI